MIQNVSVIYVSSVDALSEPLTWIILGTCILGIIASILPNRG